MTDIPPGQVPPPPPPPPPGGYGGPPPGGYGGPPPGGYGGPIPGAYGQGPKPDNYLVWAILTTLFCCLPFGIASIVYAAKVDGLWATGQQAAAYEASQSAKKWAIVAASVGLVAAIGWAIFYFIILGVAASTSY